MHTERSTYAIGLMQPLSPSGDAPAVSPLIYLVGQRSKIVYACNYIRPFDQ
jgi:hypothetical protein